MALTCTQAANVLLNRGHLALDGEGQLSQASCGRRIKHALSPNYHFEEVQKIVLFINDCLQQHQPRTVEHLALGEALIERYKGERTTGPIFREFDRALAPYRARLEYHFPENAKEFAKWQKGRLNEQVFQEFPHFVQFLKDSKILNQIKASRDQIQIIEREPAILVEERWVKKEQIYTRFKIEHSEKFNQTFLMEKSTGRVFTYLDNGRGLQPHHPALTPFDRPISVLQPDDYQKIKACAEKFQRTDDPSPEAERPHVIQIVSSKVKGPNTNLHNLAFNAKHPWFRTIENLGDKAEVYDVGFYGEHSALPLTSSSGSFRSPDSWEFLPAEERVVTNIPVSQDELNRFKAYVRLYHNESQNLGRPIGFSFDKNNCTAFVKTALEIINIDVPTKLHLHEAVWEFMPDSVQRALTSVGESWKSAKQAIKRNCNCKFVLITFKVCEKVWQAVKAALKTIIAFFLNPIRACLGSASGRRAIQFRAHNDEPAEAAPPLWNWKNYFSLASYNFHLPGKLQRWQREQPSTFVVQDPIRLTIVPPAEE
ncbi:MAG: hypothetical protein JSS32_04565 [Verrucomicrobia bacterium]|nr:hypothetical protein [Verrucomicrobiota bacterium]